MPLDRGPFVLACTLSINWLLTPILDYFKDQKHPLFAAFAHLKQEFDRVQHPLYRTSRRYRQVLGKMLAANVSLYAGCIRSMKVSSARPVAQIRVGCDQFALLAPGFWAYVLLTFMAIFKLTAHQQELSAMALSFQPVLRQCCCLIPSISARAATAS